MIGFVASLPWGVCLESFRFLVKRDLAFRRITERSVIFTQSAHRRKRLTARYSPPHNPRDWRDFAASTANRHAAHS